MPGMSEAKKRANKKWNDANLKERYDRIQLVIPKGRKQVIEDFAKKQGESVNGLINRLLQREMKMSDDEWKRSTPEDTGAPSTDDL